MASRMSTHVLYFKAAEELSASEEGVGSVEFVLIYHRLQRYVSRDVKPYRLVNGNRRLGDGSGPLFLYCLTLNMREIRSSETSVTINQSTGSNITEGAVPWLRRLVAGLPPRRPGFDREICGGQSGTGTDFSPEYFGFLLSISFHRCSITCKNEKKKTNHLHHRVAK